MARAEYHGFDAACVCEGAPSFPVRYSATRAATGWHVRLRCEVSAQEPDLGSASTGRMDANGTALQSVTDVKSSE